MLEPCEGKLSCTVLRGEGGSNTVDLLDRPADIEQREGRIIRQGNENEKIFIYRYVTENTFDAYSWQLLEQKQRFISQIMNGQAVERSCDDIDNAALSFAELKALSAGDPRIKERMDLEVEVAKLKLLKANYESERYTLEDNIYKRFPKMISRAQEEILRLEKDLKTAEENSFPDSETFQIKVDDALYLDKKEGAERLMAQITLIGTDDKPETVGEYRGFVLKASFDGIAKEYKMWLCGEYEYKVTVGSDPVGNITRLNNALQKIPAEIQACKNEMQDLSAQIARGEEELKKPFEKEEELKEKSARLIELDVLLKLNEKTPETIAEPEEQKTDTQPKKEVCGISR